jgi:hypothetical protein
LKQPEAHRDKTLSYHVWKLNKALFGLKESWHVWNLVMDEFLKSHGSQPSGADPSSSSNERIGCLSDSIWILSTLIDFGVLSNTFFCFS